nr:hypothetical protein [Streptomyces sp. NBC_00557]
MGARLRPLPGHRPGPARRQGEGRAAMTTSRPVTGARGLLGQDVPA